MGERMPPLVMGSENTALIIIDVQDKLIRSINSKDKILLNIKKLINRESIKNYNTACAEISLKDADFNKYYQFQRKGHFKLDKKNPEIIFNQTVTLRDNIKF